MKTSEDNDGAMVAVLATGAAAVLAVPLMCTFLPIIGWSLGVLGLAAVGKVRENLGTASVTYVKRRKPRLKKKR